MPSLSALTSSDELDVFSRSSDFGTLKVESEPSPLSQIPNVAANDTTCNYSLVWQGEIVLDGMIATSITRTFRNIEDARQLKVSQEIGSTIIFADRSMSLLYSMKTTLVRQDGPTILTMLRERPGCQATPYESTSFSDQLFGRVGFISRRNDAEGLQMLRDAIKRAVLASHRSGLFPQIERRSSEQWPGPLAASPLRTEHINHSPISAAVGPQMQAYTMAMNEHAQSQRQDIRYSFQQADFGTPPSFQAKCLYDGKEYNGEGPSKSAAKHMASKQACEGQNIQVTH